MSTWIKMGQSVALATLAASVLSGCSYAVKTGANVALGFSEKHIVPPILAMDDVDMVCNSGNSLTPAVMSTQDMGADPTRLAVLLYSASGICAESQANNAELRYLRAAKAGQITEAQDARIEQKRWAATAAKRQYQGYQLFSNRWESRYKIQLGDSCPKMKSDLDQTIYLLGMLSGLQAVVNDINSGGQVNVPKDIAGRIERGMACLDNEKFWGAPNATRAVIWTLLPGADEGKPDPYVTLKQSMQIGEQKGVRLAHAMYALAAQASGDDAKLRDALKTYAASRAEDKPVNPDFRLLDAMAGSIIRGISDRYWTENTGTRTDDGGMATFWDEQAQGGSDLEDLFNDGEAGASPESAPADSLSNTAESSEESSATSAPPQGSDNNSQPQMRKPASSTPATTAP